MRRQAMRLAGLGLLAALVAVAALAPVSCPAGALARVGAPLLPPQPGLLLGTDDLGRSVACLTAFGLRASLAVSAGVLALALAMGVAVGLAAGYAGWWVEAALSRLIAAFQVTPRFFLTVLVAGLFGPSLAGVVAVLGLTSWPLVARLVRAETLSIRRRPFVTAAEALGCAPASILWRHVLPNALPPVRAAAPVLAGGAVLAEAALGFVGLSDGRTVSLGRLIADAYPFLTLAPWISAAPVLALAALVLSVHAACLGSFAKLGV